MLRAKEGEQNVAEINAKQINLNKEKTESKVLEDLNMGKLNKAEIVAKVSEKN